MTWFYQPHGSAEECSLFPSHIDKEVVLRKAVVLVTGETNSDRDTNDVSLVEVLPSMTATLPSLLEELFGPGLASGQHAPKPHYCSAEIRLGESIVDIKPVLQRPNPNLLASIATAKFELGKLDEARELLAEAIEHAESRGMDTTPFNELLESYQSDVQTAAEE